MLADDGSTPPSPPYTSLLDASSASRADGESPAAEDYLPVSFHFFKKKKRRRKFVIVSDKNVIILDINLICMYKNGYYNHT